jgi:hypothetical protein
MEAPTSRPGSAAKHATGAGLVEIGEMLALVPQEQGALSMASFLPIGVG